jgi:hypothetical protein
MNDKKDYRAQFERMGPKLVRAQLEGYRGKLHLVAVNWLAEKDRADTAAEDASRREQIAVARDAAASARLSAEAARTSNKIAIAAFIAAVMAIIISIISIFITH